MDNLHYIIVMVGLFHSASAQWGYSQEEIDVFDLADEFKANFYVFMGVAQDAASTEIRRSYRKMSLTMHPDKNKTEGAEENFRLLAAVYEILKNKEKREIYDNVLANGIPSAYLYVPKQMRKMSLTEVSIIIALIFTCGHYLFMWGSYAEKRLALEEILPRLRKKKLKGKKKSEAKCTEEIDSIPDKLLQKPKLLDILPIAIIRGLYNFSKFLPVYIRQRREEAIRLKQEEKQLEIEEMEAAKRYEEEIIKRDKKKVQRKERMKEIREDMLKYVETSLDEAPQFQPFQESSNTLEDLEEMYDEWAKEKNAKKKNNRKTGWSTEDESDLVKLMSKYPVGSAQRWQLIADELNKRVPDVISKAKQIKNTIGKVNTSSKQTLKPSKRESTTIISNEIATVRDSDYEQIVSSNEKSDKILLEERDEEDSSDQWNQSQQKLFELALQQFSKGTPERWEKIAKCVPSKEKEECIARYRYLAEKVQQKKKHKS